MDARAHGRGPRGCTSRGAALRQHPQRTGTAPARDLWLRGRAGLLPDVHRAGASASSARVAGGDGCAPSLPEQDERNLYEAVEDAFGDVWGRPRGTFERFSGFTRQEGLRPLPLVSRGERRWDHWRLPLQDRGLQGEVDVVAVRHPWRGRSLGARAAAPRLRRSLPPRCVGGGLERGRREHHRGSPPLPQGRYARRGTIHALPEGAAPGPERVRGARQRVLRSPGVTLPGRGRALCGASPRRRYGPRRAVGSAFCAGCGAPPS